MSKETPILFSAPMSLAIREGRKTQTRRVINPQPHKMSENGRAWLWKREDGRIIPNGPRSTCAGSEMALRESIVDFCPYGAPGDLLYVKETHWRYGKWVKDGRTKTGRQRWRFKPVGMNVQFEPQPKIPREQEGYHKRPSIFMPKDAARTWLKIIGVRGERVQDISGPDALAEGCLPDWDAFNDETEGMEGWEEPEEFIEECENECDWVNCGTDLVHSDEHKEWQRERKEYALRLAYHALWDSLNGKRPGCSWPDNPWCWCITFKRTENK